MFKTRLLSGIFLVLAVVLALRAGGLVLFFTLLGVSLMGVQEILMAMGATKSGDRVLEICTYLGTCLYYLCVYIGFERFGLMGLVGAMLLLLFVYVFTYPRYQAGQVMAAMFSVLYVAVMLSFIYLIRGLPGGISLCCMVFFCSWGCDTCAYCVGMLIGKHKMTPVLSPKKSIEGAVGGVAGSMLLGGLLAYFLGRPVLAYVAIGAFGALVSMVGDLAASAIKRNQGIKDYAQRIPGHGGIMDRFDSVIITAPIIYYMAILILTETGAGL